MGCRKDETLGLSVVFQSQGPIKGRVLGDQEAGTDLDYISMEVLGMGALVVHSKYNIVNLKEGMLSSLKCRPQVSVGNKKASRIILKYDNKFKDSEK